MSWGRGSRGQWGTIGDGALVPGEWPGMAKTGVVNAAASSWSPGVSPGIVLGPGPV